jgi:hypothetical protein
MSDDDRDLICRRCGRLVRVSRDHYETFERGNWVPAGQAALPVMPDQPRLALTGHVGYAPGQPPCPPNTARDPVMRDNLTS